MTNWSRLSKLAGMLGSPHDGERLNAARLLDAALRRDGLTFGDLAKRISTGNGGYESVLRAHHYAPPKSKPMHKMHRPRPSRPVPKDVLDDLGLGAQRGTYTGEPEAYPPRQRGYRRTHTQARTVDDMPDARDDIDTRGNTAWAARKVDFFDDDLGF